MILAATTRIFIGSLQSRTLALYTPNKNRERRKSVCAHSFRLTFSHSQCWNPKLVYTRTQGQGRQEQKKKDNQREEERHGPLARGATIPPLLTCATTDVAPPGRHRILGISKGKVARGGGCSGAGSRLRHTHRGALCRGPARFCSSVRCYLRFVYLSGPFGYGRLVSISRALNW